jgi:hypothetical protein
MMARPDSGSEQPRFFTVEEANRTLPLVRKIVQDIVEGYPEFQRQRELYRQLGQDTPGPALQARLEALREAIDRYTDRLHGFLRELDQVGCILKDYQEGLVDYYTVYRGRPVLLCWQIGEPRIAFWHELDTGFGGRQPITQEFADEVRRSLPA